MKHISQSPTAHSFVQNPYPLYRKMRKLGPLVWWDEYDMPCATTYESVNAVLRDKRFGREMPADLAPSIPAHMQAFYDIEAHSMLELDAPRHTALRSLVLRAFTSRRIRELAPEITALCHQLIDVFPSGHVDLLSAYAQKIPVIIIARLLGVPESMCDQLLSWSNAMVAMYQAGRTRACEDAAATASLEFADFLRGYVEKRRHTPADDLITHLIAAKQDGEKLTTDELITTCILLLNAGHEATVHSMGNGIKLLLENEISANTITTTPIDLLIEEMFRFAPPLHIFTRIAKSDITVFGHNFKRGQSVACLLASANRDPATYDSPEDFRPNRPIKANTSFGGGVHFCVGAPLARLELQIAIPVLFARHPNMRLLGAPQFADLFHFHGLKTLEVSL